MKSVSATLPTSRDPPPRASGIAMFVILLASYVVNAMDRQIFPLLAADVRREFGFSLADTGLLATIFTLGMAIAGSPTAYLLTRFSRKSVVQVGIAIFSIGTILTAYPHGFTDLILYRAATGIGEAMQLTALIAIGTASFPRRRAVAVGSINAAFGAGAIVGPLLASVAIASYGTWRAPIVLFGLIGFAVMALILVAVRPSLTEVRPHEDIGFRAGGEPTLLNRNTTTLSALSVIGGLTIYGYLGLYPTFLREQLKFSQNETAQILSVYGVGVLCSLLGGWLGDRFLPRRVLGVAFSATAVLGFLIFAYAKSFTAQTVLSFSWGFVVSGTIYVNLASSHVKAVTSTLVERASGLFVTSFYGAAALAGYVLGFMVSLGGWSNAGLIQMVALPLVGVVLCVALRPATDLQSRRTP